MIIAVLKESKAHEGRVALTPEGTSQLIRLGHEVRLFHDAGLKVGYRDEAYEAGGAQVVGSLDALLTKAQLILKVKEPTLEELEKMNSQQILFCFLHLAAFPEILKKIILKKIIALGYETLQLPNGYLPLLAPMSEIAGKLATQNGAHFLRSDQGGRGILMGGTQKIKPAEVIILGGGVVGMNAARIAIGMGATTHVFEISEERLRKLKNYLGKNWKAHLSTSKQIKQYVPKADLLIGAILIPGGRAPKLVSEGLVQEMKKRSVIIDVAVDQGGCIETSEVTSHENPIVVKHGVLHYGVPNIPGCVPLTSTPALTRETLKYIKSIAKLGLQGALKRFPELQSAINVMEGEIVHPALRQLFHKPKQDLI